MAHRRPSTSARRRLHRNPAHRLPAILRHRAPNPRGEDIEERNSAAQRERTQAPHRRRRGCVPDVREPYEYKIAQIGGKLIPQDEVPRRLAEIDRDREVIVHCHSGVRSQRIAEFLKQAGYPRVVNLIGGIHAWSEEIDPRVQKY